VFRGQLLFVSSHWSFGFALGATPDRVVRVGGSLFVIRFLFCCQSSGVRVWFGKALEEEDASVEGEAGEGPADVAEWNQGVE